MPCPFRPRPGKSGRSDSNRQSLFACRASSSGRSLVTLCFVQSEQAAGVPLRGSALPLGYAWRRLDSNQHVLRVGSARVERNGAHARIRTGSHRVRGGCSTIEKHGQERTRFTRAGRTSRERHELQRIHRSSGEAIIDSVARNLVYSQVRVGLVRVSEELQREESNLRVHRLTGGCLTIRLRWKNSARRGARSNVLHDPRSSLRAPGFQRAWGPRTRSCGGLGSGRRIRTCVSGFRDQRPAG